MFRRFKDFDYIVRLKKHDRLACECLIDEHYRAIYRQHWAMCRNPDQASDLTQETFIEIWKSISKFQSRSSLKTWIHTIALRVWQRNLSDQLRSNPYVTTVDFEDDIKIPSFESCVDDRDIVVRALFSLSEPNRQTVVLFYLEGFSYKEIAEILSIPIGTVKSRLNESLSRMKMQIENTEKIETS